MSTIYQCTTTYQGRHSNEEIQILRILSKLREKFNYTFYNWIVPYQYLWRGGKLITHEIVNFSHDPHMCIIYKCTSYCRQMRVHFMRVNCSSKDNQSMFWRGSHYIFFVWWDSMWSRGVNRWESWFVEWTQCVSAQPIAHNLEQNSRVLAILVKGTYTLPMSLQLRMQSCRIFWLSTSMWMGGGCLNVWERNVVFCCILWFVIWAHFVNAQLVAPHWKKGN